MSSVNKAIIIGNLGRDPEIRYTNSGKAVCSLSVATTFKDKTEWHRVTVWDKQAEFCNQYLSKGRQVYIEGRIETSSYEGKDGAKRYSTEIVAGIVQFLGKQEERSQRKPDTTKGDDYTPPPPEDDIPF